VDRKQKNGEIALSAIDQERLNTLLTLYREVRAPITQGPKQVIENVGGVSGETPKQKHLAYTVQIHKSVANRPKTGLE
jgi:hypothetical protein